jgi:hypothetical protein
MLIHEEIIEAHGYSRDSDKAFSILLCVILSLVGLFSLRATTMLVNAAFELDLFRQQVSIYNTSASTSHSIAYLKK